jgi:hypothetical protein
MNRVGQDCIETFCMLCNNIQIVIKPSQILLKGNISVALGNQSLYTHRLARNLEGWGAKNTRRKVYPFSA